MCPVCFEHKIFTPENCPLCEAIIRITELEDEVAYLMTQLEKFPSGDQNEQKTAL